MAADQNVVLGTFEWYFLLVRFMLSLTLPAPCISESYIKIDKFSLWCHKNFMMAFKAFRKPFKAPQKSMKVDFSVFVRNRDGKGSVDPVPNTYVSN